MPASNATVKAVVSLLTVAVQALEAGSDVDSVGIAKQVEQLGVSTKSTKVLPWIKAIVAERRRTESV